MKIRLFHRHLRPGIITYGFGFGKRTERCEKHGKEWKEGAEFTEGACRKCVK